MTEIPEEYRKKLENCYNADGQLLRYPSKRTLRPFVLARMAENFEFGRDYTEKEVNAIIKANIAFTDIELIRRELFEAGLLDRLRDGSRYWKSEE